MWASSSALLDMEPRLTTSQDAGDVSKAYDLHANCYITKPVDFLQFPEVVQAIAHFWFAVVTLPRR